ncbi:MAG: HAMP domain-containing sensor histidine kinase [Lachnospiraceae bacterium]|nr:HAMP domain-containing sensor histidine kinase [Lachnospiraceae bacterium]
MRKLEKIIRFLLLAVMLLFSLLIINLIIMATISYRTNSMAAYVEIETIAEQLSGDEENGFLMSDYGKQLIDGYQGFAILIGEDGSILWDYKKPTDIPDYYSRKDIASFSKWYLEDYPVYTWNVESGIFVIGEPKGSLWKYNIGYSMKSMKAYLQYVPIMIMADLLMVIILPILYLRSQAKRKEKERTTWIAGVSHDIRTPLSVVLGSAAVLKKECTDEDLKRKAALIEEQAIRMRTLIANLNTENRLSYGMGHWNKEEIVLAELIRDTVCDVINKEPGEQYEFSAVIEEQAENLTVRGDRELIRRLLENLVQNAIKHNPKGCHVEVRLETKGGLYIVDDGVGVTKEQLYTLNHTKKEDKLPEHGLGIRLVKQICALYHWKVSFYQENERGLGCRISWNFSKRI